MGYPIKKLQEVCEKITDGTHQTPTYFNKGVIFLSSKNVTTGKIDWNNIKYIDEKQHTEISKRITPKKGDILLVKNGTTGIGAKVDKEEIFDIYVSLALLRPTEIINGEYLLYFINSSLAKTQFNSRLKGVGVPNLHLKEIKEVLIPIASLQTQKLIVQKLDSSFEKIDKSIELTKKNLENIEELNKSVLEEVFKNTNFKEKTIDEISEVKSGKRLPKGEKVIDNKTNFPYIRVSDFSDNGTIDTSNLKYITETTFNQISRYIITENDLYISIAGTIGKTGIIPSELNGANLTENAVRLVYKNKDNIYNKYIYYFTTSEYFKDQAGLATRAVAMPKLAITRLKTIKIPFPPLEKQKEIVLHLDQVFEKNRVLKEKYEKKLKDLEEMKQSLLKEAFEGRLV